MDTFWYEFAGLVVYASFPLPALRVAASVGQGVAGSLSIEMGSTKLVPDERPSSDVVAEMAQDGIIWYTVAKVNSGYVCRFYGAGDFEISESLDRIVCFPDPKCSIDFLPILLAGTVIAFVIAARGGCVLHASAVEVDGKGCLAFVGSSGRGKTTVASLLCAAGAPLVTDDILPLEFATSETGNETVYGRRATHELRIRPTAEEIVGRFSAHTPRRLTADERWALSPVSTQHDRLILSAIVLPCPDRSIAFCVGRRLDVGEATLNLGRNQRIEGWRRPEDLRRQFFDVSKIAAVVPVYEVLVPWGPPFPPDLAEQVLQTCGLSPFSSND